MFATKLQDKKVARAAAVKKLESIKAMGKPDPTRQANEFDDEVFFGYCIGRRVWVIEHKKSGREFIIRGHSNIHQFWADEYVIVNKKESIQPTIVKSNQSKKECLLLLEKFCALVVAETFKPVPKPTWVRPEVRMPEYVEIPVVDGKLLVKALTDTKFIYKTEAGEKYIVERHGSVWSAHGNKIQPIAIGMKTHEEALKELVNYLGKNPYVIKPSGLVSVIVVEKRDDGTYLVSTYMKENEELLYSSIEDNDEDMQRVVNFERELSNRLGYIWELRVRDQVAVLGNRRSVSSDEVGEGERIIRQEVSPSKVSAQETGEG